MHVVVSGSRHIEDYGIVAKALIDSGFEITEIIYGGAKGVDHMAAQFADKHGIQKILFKADWDVNGRAAGPIRNSDMIKYVKELGDGALVAVWDGQSRGTFDCIKKAFAAELPIYVVTVRKKSDSKQV